MSFFTAEISTSTRRCSRPGCLPSRLHWRWPSPSLGGPGGGFIAHGRYVTSDVIVSLFIFLAIALWLDYLESGRFRTLAGASASVGLALASKFSALILIPLLAMIYIVWAVKRRSFSIRHALISCAAPAVIAALIIGAVYFTRNGPSA